MDVDTAVEHASLKITKALSEIILERELDLESIVPITVSLMTVIEGSKQITGEQ